MPVLYILGSLLGCADERAAAGTLGYTQASWDNGSGNEQQPAAASKAWAELTGSQRAAATVLGYTQVNWDHPVPDKN